MAERLTFTLAGRDELSRVMNGTADSADRLRLRLAGITTDADGNLRDLEGRFLSVADAQRRVDDHTGIVQRSMTRLSDESNKLGESLKANLISLLPAAIPAAAGLASSAAVLAGQLGAVGVAAGAYALALGPQISAIGDALEAQQKYDDAVAESGATSKEAAKAQAEYRTQMEKLPPATRQAAIAVGLLKDNYKEWSDDLSGDVMAPFIKGVAVTNKLLPETTGLVKGASGEFDRLITLVGGAISTPGFDGLNDRFTEFTTDTLDHGIDRLTVFLAKLQSGDYDSGGLREWWDYAQQAGPVVFDTLENVGDALLHILEAGSGVGVGMLDVINVLTGVVAAVPPDAIALFLQLAIAIKAVKLAAAGGAAISAGLAALGVQIGAIRAAAAGTPGALGGASAAISGLSRTAKIAAAGTGIGLLLIGLDALSSGSQKPKPDIDKLGDSIIRLAESGKVGGEAARTFGKDLGGLADSLQKVVDPEGLDQVQQSIVSFFGTDSTPVKNAKEDIDALDQALAGLVSNGQADLAAAGLDRIVASLEKQGFTSEEVRGQLNDYQDALAGQALEQELAAQSMGLFGQQAQTVQAQLDAQKSSADGLRESIIALNEVNQAGLSGMIGFEAAIDAASKAAQENAGVLDMQGGVLVLNTEKQRAAATSLNDLAAKTDSAAAAARESGESWETVNGIYERGRQQLIANAMQMGLNRSEAKALADQILKTPDKTARLKGNLEDLKAKLAEAKQRLKDAPSSKRTDILADISDLEQKIRIAKDALNNLDGYSATTWIYTDYDTPHHMATGGIVERASGGPIPGFPGGGRLRGPGTPTSDSMLIWGSTGEYMVRAAAVDEYGEAFFDALNNRELQLFTGRMPTPGLPARPPEPQSSRQPQSEVPQVTYNIYPRASVITARDLETITRQEEARMRVGRPR